MRRKNPPSRELARFTQQLSMLLEVGFPPLEMTRILINQKNSPSLCQATRQIAVMIQEGGSLSDGMAISPNVFDQLYVNLVRAGEISGRLPGTLKRLTTHLERTASTRRDVISALIYPLCVITTTAAVSSFLLIFIIPSFRDLFADLGAPLPLLTRVVISFSETILIVAPYLVGVIVALVFILSRFAATPRGRRTLDPLALRIPLWGRLIRDSAIARSFRTLATTLDAGIPIMSALEVSAQSAGNSAVQREFDTIRLNVAEGRPISHSLSTSTLFSSLTIEMLEIGERTGALDTTLENISAHLEAEIARAITTLKSLLEPLLIIILGALVGTLVMAMYLPIFSMGGLFN